MLTCMDTQTLQEEEPQISNVRCTCQQVSMTISGIYRTYIRETDKPDGGFITLSHFRSIFRDMRYLLQFEG